jgi:xanthine dehydrogenase YagT iron-sulfur-binding subunit
MLPTQDPTRIEVTIHVNGTPHAVQIDPCVTLLDLLSDHLQLTGSKKGCDHGQCD